jgi:hypothetical protein
VFIAQEYLSSNATQLKNNNHYEKNVCVCLQLG